MTYGIMLIGFLICMLVVFWVISESSSLTKVQQAEIAALAPGEKVDDSEHGEEFFDVLIGAFVPALAGCGILAFGFVLEVIRRIVP